MQQTPAHPSKPHPSISYSETFFFLPLKQKPGEPVLWAALPHLPALTFSVLQQQFPNAASRSGVHTSSGLIQDHYPRATHKGNGHRQFPLHAAWVERVAILM